MKSLTAPPRDPPDAAPTVEGPVIRLPRGVLSDPGGTVKERVHRLSRGRLVGGYDVDLVLLAGASQQRARLAGGFELDRHLGIGDRLELGGELGEVVGLRFLLGVIDD